MKKLLILLACCYLSACTTYMTDLTIVSDKNVNLNKIDLDKMPQIKNVRGTTNGFDLLFIPIKRIHIKEAVDDALRKADGDVMVDSSLHYHHFWFILGWYQYEINGTVVKTREAK